MIYLTSRKVYNRTLELSRQSSGPVHLGQVVGIDYAVTSPGGFMFPTVPAALRAAMNVSEPAFLSVNAIPEKLAPMPDSYSPGRDTDFIECQALPHIPGRLGIDFATAFSICQLRVAARLQKAGKQGHAAYFVEAAGLSAAAVCSVKSCEMTEAMYAAFKDDPQEVPWPDKVLWPADVMDWLQSFGFERDDRG